MTANSAHPYPHTGFPADRSSGLARLGDFAPRAGREYAEFRNFDLGPDNRTAVSLLSPYLRHRLVAETEVLRAVLDQHNLVVAEKFIQEVFWRAYFKGWLEQRPTVWQRYKTGLGDQLRDLQTNGVLAANYERAIKSNTGIECFDVWASELVDTGYLHNHARMWFASIWIYTLKLPWQLGADFFYRHLLDGDPASNTLSWRWVCGLHTRGKTYLARADNIARYTQNRFDPAGQLAYEAPALQETEIDPQVELSNIRLDEITGPFGMLVSEEDCLPETLCKAGPPVAIIGLTAARARSPMATSQKAMDFTEGAVQNALARARRHFDVECSFDRSQNLADTLIEWAHRHNLTTIVTARAAVGPVADILDTAIPDLTRAGITFAQIHRRFDGLTWPHATHGFFKLKKNIPELLRQLDLL